MKKLNMYKFVAPQKDCRPYIKGVLHEGGKVIATNLRILVVVKREYPESLEGKIIDKKGNEIEACFPNYKRIVDIVQDTEEAGNGWNGMSQTDIVQAYVKIKGGLKILHRFACFSVEGRIAKDICVEESKMDAFAEFLRVYPEARLFVSAERNEHRFVYVGKGTPEDPESQLIFMGNREDDEHKAAFIMGGVGICDLRRQPILNEIETEDDVLEHLFKKDEIEKRRALGTTTKADLKLLEDVRIFMGLLKCTKKHFEIVGEAA